MWLQYGYSWEPNLKTAASKPMVIGQDVGVAHGSVPKQGDTAFTTYGGHAFMILKTTPERQNLTWDFIQIFDARRQQSRLSQRIGLPARGYQFEE